MSDPDSNPDDDRIAEAILKLCAMRGVGKTICPSEAARDVTADGGDWRTQMDRVRLIGSKLMEQGRIEITQRGHPVQPETAKGPIRFALSKGRP